MLGLRMVRKVARRTGKVRGKDGRARNNPVARACLGRSRECEVEPADLSGLIGEYSTLLKGSGRRSTRVETMLAEKAQWSPAAAQHLVQLAQEYGSFMLRNATAIAIALGIEDGDLDF